eukprot:g5135.t1
MRCRGGSRVATRGRKGVDESDSHDDGDVCSTSSSSPSPFDEFKVVPRKGQFVVYASAGTSDDEVTENEDETFLYHIIEPVPTRFTKGVIVFRTVYGNYVVGPTAEPQTSRSNRSTKKETIEKLRAFGETRVLPGVLANARVVGTYAGLRPATEFRDYQIKARPKAQWVTVAGIRSTGLTASPGIGEYCAELIEAVLKSAGDPGKRYEAPAHASDVVPGVTDAATLCQVSETEEKGKEEVVPNDTVPSLRELALDYAKSDDGTVCVYGRRHRVTHPISSFGLETMARELGGC